jgi:hypothetical protein
LKANLSFGSESLLLVAGRSSVNFGSEVASNQTHGGAHSICALTVTSVSLSCGFLAIPRSDSQTGNEA